MASGNIPMRQPYGYFRVHLTNGLNIINTTDIPLEGAFPPRGFSYAWYVGVSFNKAIPTQLIFMVDGGKLYIRTDVEQEIVIRWYSV